MKIGNVLIGLVVLCVLLMGGLMVIPRALGRPPKAEVTQDIALCETAFLVPLMGDSKDAQMQVTSAEALAQHKVIGKRVSIPLRRMKTGYFSFDYVPSMATIIVNRTPIMELWSKDPFHTAEQANQGVQPGKVGLALRVQSSDGIKFAVPATISALVLDEDSAVFQSLYRGKSLNDIVNTDVRNYAQSFLSAKFAAVDLAHGRMNKVTFIKETEDALAKYFKGTGITIEYFGLYEGLIFDNRKVQEAIEQSYINNLEGKRLSHAILAENIRNSTKTETSNADQSIAAIAEEVEEPLRFMRIIELARLQATLVQEASKKFDSSVPTQVLPAGGTNNQGLLMQLPGSPK